MARFAFIRWMRGLIPAFIMLFLMACAAILFWVSVWGLPSQVRHLVEDGLRSQGIDVEMGNLRVSIWGGLFLEASDIVFRDKLIDEQDPSTAEKLMLDLDMDSLWKGEFRLDRLEVVDGKVVLPLRDKDGPTGRSVTLDNFNANLIFGAGDSIDIREATGQLQGMDVNVSGRVNAGSGGSTPLSKEEVDRIVRQVDTAAAYLNEVKWPHDSPPSWNIRFDRDSQLGASRAVVELEAAELRYKHLKIRDVILDTEISGKRIWVKKFQCREVGGRGKLGFVSHIDLATRTIQVGMMSEVPLFTWIRQVSGTRMLPVAIALKSIPTLRGEASVAFSEDWSAIDEIKIRGNVNVGRFDINELPFLRFSTRFSYEKPSGAGYNQSKFYVTDFSLLQDEHKLEGQVLGADGKLTFEVRNTLTVETISHLVHSFSQEKVELPEEFQVRGAPDFLARGQVDFPGGWNAKPRIESGRIVFRLEDFSLLGVDLGSIALNAEMTEKKIMVRQCTIWNAGRQFDFKGELKGGDVYFACTSNIPPSIFNKLIEGSEDLRKRLKLPSQLRLPENADFSVKGIVSLSDDSDYFLQSVELSLKTDGLQWNAVEFDRLNVSVEMFGDRIQYASLEVSRNGKNFDLFAQGDLKGDMMLIGQTRFRLDTFDKLLNLEDDDFFHARFQFTESSYFDVGFMGRIDLSSPADSYHVNADLKAGNTYYQGVLVKSAQADVRVDPNVVTLTSANISMDNAPYLASRKLTGGVQEGRLIASKVVLDFNNDSASVEALQANAYPDYALKMFSPKAAEVVSMFRAQSTVSISGNGVFPMEDDFSMMKSTLSISGGRSRIDYDLLGTTLSMTNVSGTVAISPQWVRVNNLVGNIWGGRFEGKIDAQIDQGDAINGVIAARGLDLAQIGRSYDTKMNSAQVEASISFRSRNGDVKTMTGQGMALLRNGNLVEIPIFGLLGEAIGDYIPGVSHLINYNINTAGCDFYIENGFVKTQTFSAEGSNMALNGSGSVNLDTTQVNANFQLSFRGIPWLLTSPVYILAKGLFRVQGKGPLDNVRWSLAPFSRAKN